MVQLVLDELLKKTCIEAFCHLFPTLNTVPLVDWFELTETSQEKFGHYQCNSAMKLTKLFQQPPRAIAEALCPLLENCQYENVPLFSSIEVAGPGFINLTVHHELLAYCVQAMQAHPNLGIEKTEHPIKVVVDFSCPNVAKEMHVGHLRSTIIGDCIARLFAFLGHNVLRLNHIGDWGTQFGMLIAYLKAKNPNIESNPKLALTLSDLMRDYRLSKEEFDRNPVFKKESQEEVVKLQSGNPLSYAIWQQICDISRNAYQEIYTLLDINLIERGESFYNPFLKSIILDLKTKQLLINSDGAECLSLDGFVNREGEPLPLMLQKSDGGFNYATTDLAAIRHRVTEENAKRIIYVTDAGQSLHFSMIFQAARKAGYANEDVQLDHVPFGLVLRADGKKFKTREGDTEKLIDLLTAAIHKAQDILHERNPETSLEELVKPAQILGINAVKYADLSCNRTQNYIFSHEKMLRFEGNTAAFLLYAYVRIQGIKRKIQDSDLSHPGTLNLVEPSEILLALHICRFHTALDATIRDLMPHRLTDYLYHLAEKFHAFFHQCRVEGTSQQNSRLMLCEITGRILKTGLTLLGLTTLDRM